MATANVEILIKTTSAKALGDVKKFTKGFSDGMKKVEKSAKKTSASMKSISKSAKGLGSGLKALKGIAVAAFVGWGISKVIGEMTQLAKVQDQAERGLAAVMKSMGTYNKEALKANLDLASSLQKISTFGDEVIIGAMRYLSTFKQVDNKNLESVLKTVMNLAAHMGGGKGSLLTAAKQVGKALLGQTGALKLAGISLSDVSMKSKEWLDIQKDINEQVGGQYTALLEAAGGATTQLGNTWADAGEKIGKAIQGILDNIARQLIPEVENFNELLKEFFAGEKWGEVSTAIETELLTQLKKLTDWAKKADFKQAWEDIKIGIEAAHAALKILIFSYKGWVTGIRETESAWDNATTSVGTFIRTLRVAAKVAEEGGLKAWWKFVQTGQIPDMKTTLDVKLGKRPAFMDAEGNIETKKLIAEISIQTGANRELLKVLSGGFGAATSLGQAWDATGATMRGLDRTIERWMHGERGFNKILSSELDELIRKQERVEQIQASILQQHRAGLKISPETINAFEKAIFDFHDATGISKNQAEWVVLNLKQMLAIDQTIADATKATADNTKKPSQETKFYENLGIYGPKGLDHLDTIAKESKEQTGWIKDFAGVKRSIEGALKPGGTARYPGRQTGAFRGGPMGDPVDSLFHRQEKLTQEFWNRWNRAGEHSVDLWMDEMSFSGKLMAEEFTKSYMDQYSGIFMEKGRETNEMFWQGFGRYIRPAGDFMEGQVPGGLFGEGRAKIEAEISPGGVAAFADATGKIITRALEGGVHPLSKAAIDAQKETTKQVEKTKREAGLTKEEVKKLKNEIRRDFVGNFQSRNLNLLTQIRNTLQSMRLGGGMARGGTVGSSGLTSSAAKFSQQALANLEKMKGGSVAEFRVNFTGKGSTIKPLGEKIDEMWEKMKGFNNLSLKEFDFFTNLGEANSSLQALLMLSDRIADITARIQFFMKAPGGLRSPAYFAEVRELQRLEELYKIAQGGGFGTGGDITSVAGGISITFGAININTTQINDPVALAQQIDGAIADEIKYGRSQITGALREVGL